MQPPETVTTLTSRYLTKRAGRVRPHDTYRGSRPQDIAPRKCQMLKAARLRRGITRCQMDAEREALRRWLLTNGAHVARGFTAERIHGIAQEMARGM